jgi:hypothetical protein
LTAEWDVNLSSTWRYEELRPFIIGRDDD